MAASTENVSASRLPIGQILVRLLHHFRRELFDAEERSAKFPGIKFSHLAIFGSIGMKGIRLTALADGASLSLAACSELVNELVELGYVERRPDPDDGRAKLIFPTQRGIEALRAARKEVAAMEGRWSAQLPEGEFEAACRALDMLLKRLPEGK